MILYSNHGKSKITISKTRTETDAKSEKKKELSDGSESQSPYSFEKQSCLKKKHKKKLFFHKKSLNVIYSITVF